VLIANTPKEYQQTIAQATINYQLSTPELKTLIQLYTTETTKQKPRKPKRNRRTAKRNQSGNRGNRREGESRGEAQKPTKT
jgi:hypothetical protein